jgi:MGT family glycosyltransferase
MAEYAFFNFPSYGQVNPSLAIVQELVARGEKVVYFNFEKFRASIEAVGAKLNPYDAQLFRNERLRRTDSVDDNQRLAMFPIRMIQASKQMVPQLLKRVQSERPDCLVYSDLFLWARMIAHALGIPGAALRPTFAPNPRLRKLMLEEAATPVLQDNTQPDWLKDEMARLRSVYNLPFSDIASLIRGNEDLVIVFLPRAFQPDGDTFDERFLFVGPSFHPERDKGQRFPFEKLTCRPRLYISLGTIYNNRAEFYQTCFHAFGCADWQVILSTGSKIDPAALGPVPGNFITAPHVPQLEILPQTDIFISHGGMNSTMESLYFGVPLIVIPHTNEQKLTAQLVQELELGIALDETAATSDGLQEAALRVAHDPSFKKHVRTIQQHVRNAGGFHKAADALQDYVHAHKDWG